MTTAKLEYRKYIPLDWIAITFCHLTFFGENSDKLNDFWSSKESEIWEKRNKKIASICKEIEAKQAERIPWYKFSLQSKRDKEIEELELSIKSIEDTTYEEVSSAEELLQENGLILVSSSSDGGDGPKTTTDIYHSRI